MNPYLPLDTFTPDGEPHVFNGRLYVYGSHDRYKGERYCPLDYVLYSCPIEDLNLWRNEGVIYRKRQDPANSDGSHDLYAPDAVQGKDGRYYLYYVLESYDAIGAAVSDYPQGPFEYYGEVRYPYGVIREQLPIYPASFDPGVLNHDGHIYLVFGFSVDFRIEGMKLNDQNTAGLFITELEDDMLTMKQIPELVIPGIGRGKNTSFEGHEFLEAGSLRWFEGHYYLIYSSQLQHELCYSISDEPFGPYTYAGVLVSNAFENGLKNNWANNHGSIEYINGSYYIFYHRHTCGTQYSRQGCAEKIEFDGTYFKQAVITSSGLTEGNLKTGTYDAAYACFVHDADEGVFLEFNPYPINHARIEGKQIVNITDTEIVFRYFEHLKHLSVVMEEEVEGALSIFVNKKKVSTSKIRTVMTFETDAVNAEVRMVFHCRKPAVFSQIVVY